MRETGKVLFYDGQKGFGFIVRDNEANLYFQKGALPRRRRWDPEAGDRISFEVRSGLDGLFGAKVDFIPVGGEAVKPSSGCVFCDVGLFPVMEEDKLQHHIARRNEWIACTSKEGTEDATEDTDGEAQSAHDGAAAG